MPDTSRIPRAMTITPAYTGVDQFAADARRVTSIAQNTARDVRNAMSRSTGSILGAGASFTGVSGTIGNATRSIVSNVRNIASGVFNAGNAISGFGQRIEGIGRSMRSLGYDAERLGRGLTVGITLPVVGAGIAVLRAGTQFENALKKVEVLVGVNRNVVNAWGEEILRVAPSLATLPTEMAEGLFFAASAFGNLAAQAPVMEVLVAATKGAVIGLGSVEEVARVTTSLIKGFGEENINAAQAVELLVKATQQGNFEIDTLVGTLGRVIGVFATVEGDATDLLAAISTLSLTGFTTSQSVTALQTALLNLVKPSKQNAELMAEFGYNAENLQESIGDKGLRRTLQELYDTMGEANFIQIFGQRAVRAVLPLVQQLRDDYDRIATSMGDRAEESFGRMGKAGQKWAIESANAWRTYHEQVADDIESLDVLVTKALDTISGKWGAVTSQIQRASIRVYQAFSGDIKNILDRVSELIQRFEDFAVQNQYTIRLLAKLALAAAAVGPALIVMSRVFQSISFSMQLLGRGIQVFGGLIQIVLSGVAIFGRLATAIASTVIQVGVGLVRATFAAALGFFRLIGAAVAYTSIGIGNFLLDTAAKFYDLAASITYVLGRFVLLLGLRTATFFGGLVSALGFVTTAAGALIGTIGGVIGVVTSLGAPIIAAVAALGALGTAILASIGAISEARDRVTEALGGIRSNVEEALGGDIVTEARSWGEGLINAYGQGIIEGTVYVINSLTNLANYITSLLAPSSPPKIMPDIDKWGKETMQVYLDGWAKADFSVLFAIGDRIKSYLTSVLSDPNDEDRRGEKTAIEAVLGSRDEIANAINQIRDLGRVSQSSFRAIFDAIGYTSYELEGYIKAILNLEAANRRLAQAQDRLNAVNEKYANLLAPISKRLQEIENLRAGIGDQARRGELQNVLGDRYASDRVKQLARLEIEEIGLRARQRGLETERDAAVVAAEKQVELAETQVEAAQLQLEHFEGLLDLQESQHDLLADLLKESKERTKALKALTGKLDKLLEGGEPFTGGAGFRPPCPPGQISDADGNCIDIGEGGPEGGIFGPIDKKILELKGAFGELVTAWGEAFGEIGRVASEKLSGLEQIFYNVKQWWDDTFGKIISTLAEEGERTWQTIKTELGEIWESAEGEGKMTNFKTRLEEVIGLLIENTPAAVTAFSDAINNYIIPGISDVIQKVVDLEERYGLLRISAILTFSPMATLWAIAGHLADAADRAADIIGGLAGRIVLLYTRARNSDTILGRFIRVIEEVYRINLLLSQILFTVAETILSVMGAFGELVAYSIGELFTVLEDLADKYLPDLNISFEDIWRFVKYSLLVALGPLGLAGALGTIISDLITAKTETDGWKGALGRLKDFVETGIKNALDKLLGWLGDINEALEGLLGWLSRISNIQYNNTPSPPPPSGGGDGDDDNDDITEPPITTPDCTGGRVWTGSSCECPSGTSWNGSRCTGNLPDTLGIGGSPGSAIAGISSLLPSFGGQVGALPTIISSGANAAIATAGGVVISFGNVIINDDMDMALFEERIRRVVLESIS